MSRITWRLLPLMMACYVTAYLDRVNVGFAQLQMSHALGIDAAAYGLGAGLFFISYMLCEAPSNIVLYKVGARLWIARIMLTWGVCAGAMAFIQGPASFYVLRLLLGAAEAGLQPGMLFFMTLWFPAAYRGRAVGLFMAAVPITGIFGSPLSGALLSLRGFGLMGWQWLFLIEALPTIILAAAVYLWLRDGPQDAPWLAPDEREWLSQRLGEERGAEAEKSYGALAKALASPLILCLAAIYFTDLSMNNANAFFLPQIVKAYGLDNLQTGFVSAIPSLFGLAGIIWWSRRSDRTGERVGHAAMALAAGAVGLIIAALTHQPIISLLALSVAVAGTFAFTAPFWALVGSLLSGRQAAVGMAAISATGALGGFVAPVIMGNLKALTGGFAAGQMTIAGMALAASILLLALNGRYKRLMAAQP